MSYDDLRDDDNPYAAPEAGPGPGEVGPAEWPEGSPWVTIWTRPRATVRKIVETDPTRQVHLLAMISGISRGLGRASSRSLGDVMPLGGVLAMAVIGGGLGGLLGLYLMGALLAKTGRWLGGVAGAEEVRAAIAWSSVPLAGVLLIAAIQVALLGEELFTSATPRLDSSTTLSVALMATAIPETILGVWSFVLLLKGVGEVHRFSAWRALGAAILAGLLVVAIILPIILLALILSMTA